MKTSEKTDLVMAAFSKAKAYMPYPVKDGSNDHFESKYASWISVLSVVMPALRENGLDAIQEPTMVDGTDCLITRITHVESGQFLEFGPVRLATKDTNDPQKQWASNTYAKRGVINSICMLAEDDDDGNRAAKPKPPPKKDKPADREEAPPPDSEHQAGALIFEGPIESLYPVKKYGKKKVCNMKVVDPDEGDLYDVAVWGDKADLAAKLEVGLWVKVEYAEKVPWEKNDKSGMQLKGAIIIEPDFEEIDVQH